MQFRNIWASRTAFTLVAVLVVGAVNAAAATMLGPSRGLNGFGITGGYFEGRPVLETYSKGFYCDTTVAAKSSSGCEIGAPANRPPGSYDPEYATVPIGFTVPAMQMNCAKGLTCVDHPSTLDMTRVAKPLAKTLVTTVAALMPTLANPHLPGHDHYLTTLHSGEAEWWNVEVVPVTSRKTYEAIRMHGSYAYIKSLLAAGDPTLMKPVPTNLFLYFAVAPGSQSIRM